MKKEIVTIEDILQAEQNLLGLTTITPLDCSTTFSNIAGCKMFLKLENMQKTGSFKVRGAANCVANLSEEERKCGVITASAGNHAQGVAMGATRKNTKATVVMPENAPLTKVEATRSYGAEVVLAGASYDDAYAHALEIQNREKSTFIHAFNDPYVIAGQGTIALEILKQNPDIKAIAAPIGGGGLLAGIALAVKSLAPQVKVYGVQASGAPSMYLSRNEGRIVETANVSTIADGIAVKRPGDLTFDIINKYVDDIVVVKDEDITATMLMMLERCKMIVEGAGATALAAVLHGLLPYNESIASVISGGNIDVNIISKIIENGLIKAGRRVRLVTDLVDRPGELLKLVTHIAELRANIIYVMHEHVGRNLPIGHTKIEIDLETRDAEHGKNIIFNLRKAGYRVELI